MILESIFFKLLSLVIRVFVSVPDFHPKKSGAVLESRGLQRAGSGAETGPDPGSGPGPGRQIFIEKKSGPGPGSRCKPGFFFNSGRNYDLAGIMITFILTG